MANDDEIIRLLTSIDRRLALLTAPQDHDLRKTLETEILKTPARIAIFWAIDGKLGSRELGAAGGVGERAAQMFIAEMLDMGLVREADRVGKAVIVERDEIAIIDWYLKRGA